MINLTGARPTEPCVLLCARLWQLVVQDLCPQRPKHAGSGRSSWSRTFKLCCASFSSLFRASKVSGPEMQSMSSSSRQASGTVLSCRLALESFCKTRRTESVACLNIHRSVGGIRYHHIRPAAGAALLPHPRGASCSPSTNDS